MLLEIKEVSKSYTRNQKSFLAVDHLSMNLDAGEFCGIIGHSGSGKSTLLNMVIGLLKPTEGTILLEGEDLFHRSQNQLAELRNSKIGYIMQGNSLLSNFTILDNVCMPAYIGKQTDGLEDRALALLDTVGLAEMKNAYPKELSGGEARRVSIARSLINSPKFIVADEPTSNLDPESAENIMELFRKIADQGTTVLCSTHDMKFLNYVDTHYLMNKGIISDGVLLKK